MRKQERKTQKKLNLPKRDKATKKEALAKGVVTARKCKNCGHHEIGIITEDGHYLGLKPGMKVEVIGE